MRVRNVLSATILLSSLACAACSPTMSVSSPTLMSGAQMSQGRRGIADSFRLNDRIIQVVDFTWADPTEDGGIHLCEWRWYRDGVLVSDTPERRLDFRRTPFTLRTVRPAAPLGVGRYTVDTVIDGKVVATSAFSITA